MPRIFHEFPELRGAMLFLANIRDDRRAVTAIEYALIASLVAVTLVAGAKSLGVSLSNTFSYIAGQL